MIQAFHRALPEGIDRGLSPSNSTGFFGVSITAPSGWARRAGRPLTGDMRQEIVPAAVHLSGGDRMKRLLTICACLCVAGCHAFGSIGSDAAYARYEPQVALELGVLSEIAYEKDRQALAQLLATRGYSLDTQRIEDAASDTSGFVAFNDSTAVVAFTGTEPAVWRDFLQDAKFWKYQRPDETYCEGKAFMHGGFHLPVIRILEDGSFHATLAEHQAAGREIRFTGHSLGAALAVVTAFYTSIDRPEIAISQIHTYGQPIVGNVDFARCFDARHGEATYRHVNNLDAVPRLRPSFRSDYRHVGTLVYFGRAERSQAYGTWSIRDWFLDGSKGRSLTDHFIGNYIKVLEKNKDRPPARLD